MSESDREASNSNINQDYARSQDYILQAHRRLLRERDPDLRAVVQRLQSEYIGKELEQQIVENQYRKLQIQIDHISNDKFVNNSTSNDTEDVQTEQAGIDKKVTYGRDLKQQIQVLRQRRQEEHEKDALNEKNMVNGIVRAIQEEDRRKLQEMRDKRQENLKQMILFMEVQKNLKERQNIILAEEEKFLEDQQLQIQDRGNNIFAEKQRKLDIQYAINKKVIDVMLADKAAKEERENLICNLVEHDHQERSIEQELFEKRNHLQMSEYNKQMLQQQIQRIQLLKLQQSQQDKLDSEQLAKQAKAEQNKKDVQMSKERANKKAYATCLLQQIQANQDKRKKDKHDHDVRNTSVATHDNQWQRDVQEEKIRLLEEHKMLLCTQALHTST